MLIHTNVWHSGIHCYALARIVEERIVVANIYYYC